MFAPLILVLLSSIQVIGAASPPKANPANEVVTLTPFEVQAEKDTGYISQNTASGSRLNSALKDTPAAISVFTAEFLQDIAAVSVEDITKYSTNTEADVGFVSASPNGNSLMNPTAGFSVRGLPTSGGPATGRTVNFFSYIFEIDTYNTDRVEFARGPNSILFGFGQAGGSFNTASRTADVHRPIYSVGARAGSHDALRGTVDLNVPIIKDRLALRFDAVADHRQGWRPWEFSNNKRMYLAGRLQLTPRTTIDVQSETGHFEFRRPRPYLGTDHVTPWIAAGRPTAATAYTSNTPNAQGVRRISATAWPVYISGEPPTTLRNFANMGRTANPLNNGDLTPMIQDFSLVPREAVLQGPGTGNTAKFQNHTAFVRHEITRDFQVEIAANRQAYKSDQSDMNGPDMVLFFDPNQNLLNQPAGGPASIPNPYVGRPYIEGNMRRRDQLDRRDDLRLTAAYRLDLGKLFGTHQFAGLGERWDQKSRNQTYLESLIDNPNNRANPEDATNQVRRRTYVDLDGPVDQIALADWRKTPLPGVGWIPNAGPSYNRYYLDSWMLAAQSRFWRDRIVTTFGYREDSLESKLSTPVRSANVVGGYTTGFFEPGPAVSNKVKGVTRTQGMVFHAHRWFSVFANHSSNFALPALNQRTLPRNPVVSPKGETEDVGAQFNLFDHRVVARVTYYQTAVKNNSASVSTGNIQDRINAIWNTLATNGRVTAAQRDQELVQNNAYNYDNDSQGWEGELVANLTSNWRLMLNASANKTTWTNVAAAIRDYVEAHRGEFAGANLPAVNDQLLQLDTFINQNYNELEGGLLQLSPKWSMNARTNYAIREGRFKNVSLGAGARFRDGTMLGYTTSDPATREAIRSGSNIVWDANIGYRRRVAWFGRNMSASIQLNVNNLFDNQHLLPQTANPAGEMLNYRFQIPREWIVSTTLSF
jgi:iron complex outermembrane recepter protein